MSDFNKENLVSWYELSPSLQELFKKLKDMIETESDRAAEKEDWIIEQLNKLAKEIDLIRGASFKSWALKLWETHHIFDDLSFYELLDVNQSGSNNKITSKTYNNLFGEMYGDLLYKTGHPRWVKHQQNYTLPDGTTRIFLGCSSYNGGSEIYMSNEDGTEFTKVMSGSGIAMWDFCDMGKMGLFSIAWGESGGSNSIVNIYRTLDGVNWSRVYRGEVGTAKTLCNFNGYLMCVVDGVTLYTSDGVHWASRENNLRQYAYSRYCGKRLYVGTVSPAGVWESNNGFTFNKVWGTTADVYTRWLCAWTPNNNNGNELIVWGTGSTGTEGGTAQLYCYDPATRSKSLLYDFRGDDPNTAKTALNYGHAPLEPMIQSGVDSEGKPQFVLGGFRERQIRYIEVYKNDITGESFLMVGTSDCHLYQECNNTELYYAQHNYDTGVSTPLTDEKTGEYIKWTAYDKEQWKIDDPNSNGWTQYGPYIGNVYAVTPRHPNAPFSKSDLAIGLIKHTNDTRVYSMNVFTDPKGVKWAYAGTGGGNYSGKGLLYRFGYSDMLNLIQAAKMGAIFPPRWAVIGEVNKRLKQESNRSYIKIMAGSSARDDYAELRFAFTSNFIKSTSEEPYIKLIFNHAGTDNYYAIKFYPLIKKIDCIRVDDNVETILHTESVPEFSFYETQEVREAADAPSMGPYYILAGSLTEGATNPNAQSSVDYYPNDDLDGTINFYLMKSQRRDDYPTASDIIYTHTINYSGGERKKIGNYGFETYDVTGLQLISMKQMSLGKYKKDALGVGEIVFAVR